MVRLEFTFDAETIADDVADYTPSEVATLMHTFFLLPTRLMVGEYDVFAGPSGRTRELPIVHVALEGLDAVRKLDTQSPVYYYPAEGGTLAFVNDADGQVRISMNTVEVNASYPELRAAFEDFAVDVRQFLAAHIPAITQSPVWRPWIESGAEPNWSASDDQK